MKLVSAIALFFALACVQVVCEKPDKCVVECVEDDWAEEDEELDVSDESKIGDRCRDSDGNIDIECQNRQKGKIKNSIKEVGIKWQHKSCSHCMKNQICVGFPEDDFVDPECLDILVDEHPCGDQCDLGEDCEHVFGNRFNCVPNPNFNICNTCTDDEICLGFTDDDVPMDCYEADDEMLCAGLCEDNEVCVHQKDNEYQCVPVKASKPKE